MNLFRLLTAADYRRRAFNRAKAKEVDFVNAIDLRSFLAVSLAVVTCFTATAPANAQSVSPAEAQQIATDAYVYGYSLITTEVTRVQMSNVPKVEGFTSPTGQFVNVPRYPPADYRGVPAPNADTLYSVA